MRLRNKISGTAACPRMAVFKSNKNLTVQCIDDVAGRTLAAASSLSKEAAGAADKSEEAKMLGRHVAEKLLAQQIDQVVFDNGGFGYKGRIKVLAEAAREAGLKF